MNMKKTIAAVAAGAVAVSAMATTVSALEAKTLTYNLVETATTNSYKKTGTVTAYYSDLELVAGDTVEIQAANADPHGATITISGSYYDDQGNSTKTINPTVFTQRKWETGWSQEGADCWGNGDTVKIPVVAQKAGTAVALVQSTRANIQVKVDYKNLPDSIGYDGALNNEIAAGTRGIKIAVKAGTTTTTPGQEGTDKVTIASSNPDVTVTGTYTGTASKTYKFAAAVDGTATLTQAGALAQSNITVDETATVDGVWTAMSATTWANAAGDIKAAIPGVTLSAAPQPATAATQAAATGTFTTVTTNAANNTVKNAAAVTLTYSKGAATTIAGAGTTEKAAAGWYVNAGSATAAAADPADYGINITTAPTDADDAKTIVVGAYTAGNKADIITTTAGKAAAWDSDPAADGLTVKGTPAANDVIIVTVTEGQDGPDTTVAAGENRYPAGTVKFIGSASNVGGSKETKQFPFCTNIKRNDDVIRCITKSDGSVPNIEERQSIRAVINDCVVNYSDVTFTFNTAVKNVKIEYDVNGKRKTYDAVKGTNNNWGFYVDDDAYDYKAIYDDSVKEAAKEPNGYSEVLDYKQFGRHFWDYNLGYDANTIYITNDWLGNNLFEGALIINRNLTLSLGATDKFDWTGTSLTFSWDAIEDAALTQNQYANYIHNMVLRTSTEWYWDNLQVVLGATESEEVDTTSPIEGEEDELGEEDVEPEEEAEPEEEPEEEEPEAEPEEEPEVAPVVEESNPGTGNAPVALAVIPVALAAAAIVAKKRG